jgi:hypothetical protein
LSFAGIRQSFYSFSAELFTASKKMNTVSIFALVFGGWLTLNGVLHDIFILASPKGKTYDRDLLRLLMDGHILITCGLIILFCAKGFMAGQSWAYVISVVAAASILVYCAMIFPFLKSMVTILLSAAFLITLFITWK